MRLCCLIKWANNRSFFEAHHVSAALHNSIFQRAFFITIISTMRSFDSVLAVCRDSFVTRTSPSLLQRKKGTDAEITPGATWLNNNRLHFEMSPALLNVCLLTKNNPCFRPDPTFFSLYLQRLWSKGRGGGRWRLAWAPLNVCLFSTPSP